MGQQTIPVDFAAFSRHYPFRTEKTGEFGGRLAHPDLRLLMDRNPGTPCCVQVSHCFNMAGLPIPRMYPGMRRPNDGQKINGVIYYYLLAVDEMEKYLTETYGPGDLVRSDDDKGLKRTAAEVKAYLKGRQGILVMREGWAGVHTELWDGSSFLQKDMAVDHLLTRPRVLFWDCTLAPPKWLSDYMAKYG
jgi:Type VI secretion system (T6SS), amidase effector protein 4